MTCKFKSKGNGRSNNIIDQVSDTLIYFQAFVWGEKYGILSFHMVHFHKISLDKILDHYIIRTEA